MGRIIEEIKGRTNVIEYARNVLCLPINRPGDRCCSLAGGSNPTALVVREDFFYDFKLAEGGDVIDLCAIARHGGDRGAAIRELAGDNEISIEWRDYTQNLCNKIAYWHEQLRESDRKYLQRRGIKLETIRKLKIGFDGSRLVIPYFKNGYVAYYITRQRDEEGPKYKKAKLDGFMENIPWGMDSLKVQDTQTPPQDILTCPQDTARCPEIDEQKLKSDVLVITEGVFDALSFYQDGYKVLSPMGGHFSRAALKQVLNICQNEETVFLCFDSDEAGNKFQMNMAKILFRNKIKFIVGSLPAGIKDVSDYYAEGGDLEALIVTAADGIKGLCERITDRNEFKDFIFDCARFIGKPEITELFELVDFPKAWLEQVKKQALAAPPDDTIVKEITAQRRLKFFEALGFYEYTAGVWRRRGDAEIGAAIADLLGHFRTGAKISSVLAVLRTECVSTEELNKKPVFNFHNGTLELETDVFREHRESDMSSTQTEYDYQPGTYSHEWEEFLEDVTECDESKMALLQEMFGYVLFSDCSLQKCFFLIGDGSNGKSVMIDIMTELFGQNSVSTIEMSSFAEPFQRIYLMSSLVNISSETKSDVRGAESMFKQIVVGDAINACYKGKDFITFRPRTKLIASMNRYIKSNDSSTGFMRRIIFINFNAKFSLDGEEGVKQADVNLPSKLKKHLPAIFNWAYDGYRLLREQKRFTETYEHKMTMTGFVQVTNPIMVFAEENKLIGRISRKDLYRNYTQWCKDNGHEAMSNTRFTQEFKQTAKQLRVKFEETVYAGERQFVFNETTQTTLEL